MKSPMEWITPAKTPQNGGIYRIHCRATGESYVGMTTGSLQRRLHFQHRADLRKGKHFNQRLQAAWVIHGEQAFSSDILDDMPGGTSAEIAARERYWIERLGTFLYGFNQTEGGEASALGYRFTPDQREKMSRSHMGKTRIFTDEHKANIQKARAGKKLSPEHRAKISEGGKGRTATEETKAKLRAAQAVRPPRAPLTLEHRAKIGIASAKRERGPLSDEHKAKLSQAHTGKSLSDETKAKMSTATKGKPKSEETKQRMKAAWIKRRAGG